MTLGAAFVVLIAYLAFPRSVAFAIQSTLIGGADSAFGLALGKPEAPLPATIPNRYRQLVELPIVVTGAQPANIELKDPRISIRTLSGVIVRSSSEVTQQGPAGIRHTISVGRDFYETAKNSPVTVRAEYVITVFGNDHSAEIALDGTLSMIDGLGQCGTTPNYYQRMLMCRSAFDGWKNVISDKIVWNGYNNEILPRPLMIHPVRVRRFELTGDSGNAIAPEAPEKPVTLVVREPVAHFRYTLEAKDVRLSDYSIQEPINRGFQRF
jgi:hypothetical protein